MHAGQQAQRIFDTIDASGIKDIPPEQRSLSDVIAHLDRIMGAVGCLLTGFQELEPLVNLRLPQHEEIKLPRPQDFDCKPFVRLIDHGREAKEGATWGDLLVMIRQRAFELQIVEGALRCALPPAFDLMTRQLADAITEKYPELTDLVNAVRPRLEIRKRIRDIIGRRGE